MKIKSVFILLFNWAVAYYFVDSGKYFILVLYFVSLIMYHNNGKLMGRSWAMDEEIEEILKKHYPDCGPTKIKTIYNSTLKFEFLILFVLSIVILSEVSLVKLGWLAFFLIPIVWCLEFFDGVQLEEKNKPNNTPRNM